MTLARQEESQLAVIRMEEDPVAVVERATRQANALMDVVEAKKQYVEIEGKKYLYVEAWEIIGAFNGVHAETEWVEPITDRDELIGFTAKVNLIKNGEVVGSGIMPCGFEDFPCRGKEGMARQKACQSAAQTWAESKAYRMNFSYVAVLGGYQPTPAEEMIDTKRTDVATKAHGAKPRATAPSDGSPPTEWPCFEKNCKKLLVLRSGKTGQFYSHKQGTGWHNAQVTDVVTAVQAQAAQHAQDVPPSPRTDEEPSLDVPRAPERRFTDVTQFWAAVGERGWSREQVADLLGGSLGNWLMASKPPRTWDDAFDFLEYMMEVES